MTQRLSVIVPTYNRASYLPFSIGSILSQTRAVHEILIVDDGSTDATPSVVAGLAGPIRYIRQPNLGPAAARNRGLREAVGELVALLDSDDVWLPHKLERQLQVLETQPEVGLVHAAATLVNEVGRPTGAVWGQPGYSGRVHSRLLVANGVNASSVVMRRAVVEQAGGYDERFGALENWDLWLRMSELCDFAYISEPLIQYRVHSGNLIRNLDRLRENYEKLLNKHLETVPPPAVWVRRQARARFHQSFADALVGQGRYAEAVQDFVESLKVQPVQPGVWWRLFRVNTARLRAQDGVREG